jgi:glutamate dehydrogenase (NAD(P)+)
MDTYSMGQGSTVLGVVTGKPVSMGGSLGRHDATGRGVVVAARAAMGKLGLSLAGARVAVQGFGNVGETAARLFHEQGAKIVALQDHTGSIASEAGLDPKAVKAHRASAGSLSGAPGSQAIDADAFWSVPCDVMVPAALEGQLTAARAQKLACRLVVEGANGPSTPDADEAMRGRGITVVPDVLANAGGVTVSYFEWVQDFSSFFWTEDEINERLERVMREAFAAVWQVASEQKVSVRTAAFIVACKRILQAREMRGLYP